MKKIRCKECGNIIAHENEPINDKGEISIMCNNRKPNGERCKTVNIISCKYNVTDCCCEFKPLSTIEQIKKDNRNKFRIEELTEEIERLKNIISRDKTAESRQDMKAWILAFNCDYGVLYGLFKATDEQIKSLKGKTIYFGEENGKHSDVSGKIEDGELQLFSDNESVVNSIKEFGYNPFNYPME